MTVRNRIGIAVIIQAAIIILICLFVYLSFKTVLSKLKTIEIIDDINISFLEIRKLEKNYFLYNDIAAIKEVISKASETKDSIQSSKIDIINNLGNLNYETLLNNLSQYQELARSALLAKEVQLNFESHFRTLGHKLTRASDLLLRQERKNVNQIIFKTIIMLIVSLGIILLFQLWLWHNFFRFMTKELAIMERMIHTVSEGHFHEVAVEAVSPKNEIEFAIKAIADMAKELEKRETIVLQSGKLAALGTLISGVAHELGNPLNNISLMSQAYLSLYDLLGDSEKKSYMADILNQTERISKIINNLLDFSRQKKQELKEYSAAEIVERSISLVYNQLKISNVRLHKFIQDNLPSIYVDATQVQQVLVNLFINSIHAMPDGGDLIIDIDNDKNNNYVVIKVRDTGIGIKQDNLPYIFDPFFTTKGTKGTGLGLSVSYGIIRQHHGNIIVESEEGKGTTFTIKLPSYIKKEK